MQRIVYSFLDYLGDIGGLFGTFNGFAGTVSLILNFNGLYHLLTSSLFRVESKISKAAKTATNGEEEKKESRVSNLLAKGLLANLNKQADKAANIREF